MAGLIIEEGHDVRSDQCVQRERLRCRVVAVPADRVEQVRRAPMARLRPRASVGLVVHPESADRMQAGDDRGSGDNEAAAGYCAAPAVGKTSLPLTRLYMLVRRG